MMPNIFKLSQDRMSSSTDVAIDIDTAAIRQYRAIKQYLPYAPSCDEVHRTGSMVSPQWHNADIVNALHVSGTYIASDRGTYTASFTPRDGYAWSPYIQQKYQVGPADVILIDWKIVNR